MDSILKYIINLIVFIPIIIILIVVSIKLTKLNSGNLDKHKYINVIERTIISKDTCVFILKIGDEGCVLLSSHSKVESIKYLSKEEIENIEEIKSESSIDIYNFDFNKFKPNFNYNKYKKIKSSNLSFGKLGKNKFSLKGNRHGRTR